MCNQTLLGVPHNCYITALWWSRALLQCYSMKTWHPFKLTIFYHFVPQVRDVLGDPTHSYGAFSNESKTLQSSSAQLIGYWQDNVVCKMVKVRVFLQMCDPNKKD